MKQDVLLMSGEASPQANLSRYLQSVACTQRCQQSSSFVHSLGNKWNLETES